jgi:hypothetical protein
MTPFVLRPFFIRSVLAAGLIAGAAFALLTHRSAPPAAPECVSPPQPISGDDLTDKDDIDPLHDETEVADHDDDADTYYLVVEDAKQGCEFYSSFMNDTIELTPGAKLAVFERDFRFEDGCAWKSQELLTRTDADTFSYEYAEHVVSCPHGHHAAQACTRTGIATRAIEGD